MPEIYISTDIETDGPIPGPHSLLSFGSAAYLADKTLVSTFTANLETLPGALGDAKTMAWWATEPECVGGSENRPAIARNGVARVSGMDQRLAWKAGLCSLSRRVRLSFCVLVSDPLYRRKSVLALGSGHQDFCHGDTEDRLPGCGQAKYAAPLVRPTAAYALCAGRCH